jgi:hypothetical protein
VTRLIVVPLRSRSNLGKDKTLGPLSAIRLDSDQTIGEKRSDIGQNLHLAHLSG